MRVVHDVDERAQVSVTTNGRHRATLLAETSSGGLIQIEGDANYLEEMLEEWLRVLKSVRTAE